jgi:hypothetical protein
MRFSATELEAPRLAAKTEKRATKNAKIQILLFSETVAANQNQKFPFHFLSAPPTPPAENLRKEGKFLVLYRDRRERTRRAESERTIQVQATTRSARGTLSAILEIGASLVK